MPSSIRARTDPIASTLIPKSSTGHRIMATLSQQDARTWERLVAEVATPIEGRLSRTVLANRVHKGLGGWRLQAVGPALRQARRRAAHLARTSPLIVRTDVTEFYPAVTPSVLARSLRDIGAGRTEASLAADMLDGWGSDGYAGLPIGPDPSAVLANAVLWSVDMAIEGWPWLRWVDDYFLAAVSDQHAEQAIEKLEASLDRLGLKRSVGKTDIVDGSSAPAWLTRCSSAHL
ncbi:MAG: RNA-directed DNA polymerase [Actinomycetota bacterium]